MAGTGSSICRAGAGSIPVPCLGWLLFVAGLGAWGHKRYEEVTPSWERRACLVPPYPTCRPLSCTGVL